MHLHLNFRRLQILPWDFLFPIHFLCNHNTVNIWFAFSLNTFLNISFMALQLNLKQFQLEFPNHYPFWVLCNFFLLHYFCFWRLCHPSLAYPLFLLFLCKSGVHIFPKSHSLFLPLCFPVCQPDCLRSCLLLLHVCEPCWWLQLDPSNGRHWLCSYLAHVRVNTCACKHAADLPRLLRASVRAAVMFIRVDQWLRPY